MELKKRPPKLEGLKALFEKGENVRFGLVSIAPGERVPGQGLSNHSEDEYSYVIDGAIEGECGGHPFNISTGEASFIPAGEEHWAINNGDGDCEIVWVLVNKL